jgi:hypothetical protein
MLASENEVNFCQGISIGYLKLRKYTNQNPVTVYPLNNKNVLTLTKRLENVTELHILTH